MLRKGESPLCGNTICQDRRFLARCMPDLESFCHYRSIDVSSIRELGKRWYFEDIDNFQKNSNHRALDDIETPSMSCDIIVRLSSNFRH